MKVYRALPYAHFTANMYRGFWNWQKKENQGRAVMMKKAAGYLALFSTISALSLSGCGTATKQEADSEAKADTYVTLRAITVGTMPENGMDEFYEELDDMTEELIDRFGDLPKKVQQLLHIAALKSLAHSAYITAIEQKGKDYKFILYEKANLDPAKIPALLKKYGNNMTFKAEAVPYFLYQKKGRSGKEKGENVLQMLREIIESIRELRLD